MNDITESDFSKISTLLLKKSDGELFNNGSCLLITFLGLGSLSHLLLSNYYSPQSGPKHTKKIISITVVPVCVFLWWSLPCCLFSGLANGLTSWRTERTTHGDHRTPNTWIFLFDGSTQSEERRTAKANFPYFLPHRSIFKKTVFSTTLLSISPIRW